MGNIIIKPHRHFFWGYNQVGAYFITIVTKDKIKHFGRIENGKMIYNRLGFYAKDFISEIPSRFRNTQVKAYQVMPNHVHLLLWIKRQKTNGLSPVKRVIFQPGRDSKIDIRQKGLHPLEEGSIASVINHYKGRVTSWSRNHNYQGFQWQANYYDKIIWNSLQYHRIEEYIKNNPANWGKKGMKKDE